MPKEKEEVKIIQITKEFARTWNDGNYGSVRVGTILTAQVNVTDKERLREIEDNMADSVLKTTMSDMREYQRKVEKGEAQ